MAQQMSSLTPGGSGAPVVLPPDPSPFAQFVRSQSFAGLLLFLAAALAFVLANSPLSGAYEALRHLHLGVTLGGRGLDLSLEHWVNDGLMAVFFLLVGLEIKRELLIGELANPRRAALAVAGALGGMAVPALLYAALNGSGPGLHGWGIPMATDIAFSLGILALLGSRVPVGLKVFLTALAIVDDLGAVIVIALFYTSELNFTAMLGAALTWGALLLLGRRGVRRLGVYAALGVVLWLFVLGSGLHATIAGVLLALAVPLRRAAPLAVSLSGAAVPDADNERLGIHLQRAEAALERAQSPLHRLEHALHPYVTYAILPLFAFMNAGVAVGGATLGTVTLGVVAGLVLGKPLGVLGGAWLAVRAGLAALPEGVNWSLLAGAGMLAGIGFTVSLFVANLAFTDATLLTEAKLGVLIGTLCSAALGVAWLLLRTRRAP
ncbi:Na+/H+ antiporter NhaA [Deinococcus petrolearius]|uniref:Na(+)/H(+) antiporter NhaA n=1 Tax=Deinococcus petrolearius TaxID=1751295 RepID=A0ABW1DJ58_9DEIO